ncbi:putative MscS family protein [Zancudomyces culisetae]|nr:putative MscS family protein [Zancudomyces culisetae]|eukprot:OMH86048.1 putative MscS family protein [Zancudomyces culisetae]
MFSNVICSFSDKQKTIRKEAKKVFYYIINDKSKEYLTVQDFTTYYKNEDVAIENFGLFDYEKNGNITLDEFQTTFLFCYDEKKSVQRSIKDIGKIIKQLDGFLSVVCYLVVLIICLSTFAMSPLTFISTAGTAILGKKKEIHCVHAYFKLL